ncbi:PorT family protein [Tamlana sp. 62-3]|uniref:PorT family protein n=1 Tax=Neotamlana sargassicola TaxID=2883125 RepID=A0A9X1I556_9FLAO|nr:porin family protein [Tamlana sargassicola]MCB4808050.1 PorT family protein [Tamlana sargassicola]
MKNKLLSLLLLLLVSTSFAQVTFKPGLRFGANFSEITNTSSYKNKTNFYAGVFAEIKFTEFYALQPELFYSKQGAKHKNNEGDIDIDYLSVALANKFFIDKNSGLHIILGPSIDINLEYNWVSVLNDNVDYELTPIDLSLLGGIGYEFPNGLSIEARLKQGLIDLDLFNNADYNDNENNQQDDNQLNKVFQLGITYKFKFR